MFNKESSYRLQYYEDDVVKYTDSGKFPKLPKGYDKCTLYYGNHKHILKRFYTAEQAQIACKMKRRHSYTSKEDIEVTTFACPKCCMYHIIPTRLYEKYFK